MKLDAEYWDERYKTQNSGWDIGYPSPAICKYFDNKDTSKKILIPGCGNAYEGEYLFNNGFKNITLLDYSETSKQNFLNRVPGFNEKNYVIDGFFEHKGSYDFIVEQTFFCALDPSLREKYAKKMHELLAPGGQLIGLLFDDPLYEDHPPYGGNKEEYLSYFSPLFSEVKMTPCHSSIPERSGRELFIILKK